MPGFICTLITEDICLPFVGDLMGRALRNLDSLLEMPFGCGEQNMLRFAPNIYIMQYLQSSDQLTPQIRDKASTFLVSGEEHLSAPPRSHCAVLFCIKLCFCSVFVIFGPQSN